VKRSLPQVKVIVLTGYADLRNRAECKQLGADDFISKPYNFNDVLDSLAHLAAG